MGVELGVRFGVAARAALEHHDASMRTTLTLEDDVAEMIDDAVHREKKTMKQVVNEALRRGLAPGASQSRKRFRVRPHCTSLRPGIDVTGFNRLSDELEDEAVLEKYRRGR